jgi:cardiolipin synthase
MRRLLNLPNLLTLARLLAAPWVAACILRQAHGQALVLLAVAGFTDVLDGYLARRLNCSTHFGAYLDPIADKVLLVIVFVSLGIVGLIPTWLVMIVVGRDLLILVFAGVAFLTTHYRRFEPSVWGKLSTLVQILTGVAVIGSQVFRWPALLMWATVLPVATAVTTVWSGLHYAWRAVGTLYSQHRTGAD